MRNLASSVWAKIKEYNRISGIYHCTFVANRRLNKFIGNSRFIEVFERFNWIFFIYSHTTCHRIVSFFYTFPPIVSVHGVISAHNCYYFSDF